MNFGLNSKLPTSTSQPNSIGIPSSTDLPTSANQATASEQDTETKQLEKKRQISQMYQYYNYLIFEKNKDSFNDINPDLRKMTYKYDSEVKNAYMTVQASPEVIKAAMGMNVGGGGAKSQGVGDGGAAGGAGAESQPPHQLNIGNGFSSLASGTGSKDRKEDKVKKYGKETILNIFQRNANKIVSPMD